MNAIQAYELTRYYGKQRGVAGLNLSVPEGSIFGLLGENGCGKTTTIKLAMGALVPDDGRIRVLGGDPVEMTPSVRARVGWVADEMELPRWMSLDDAMALQASYHPQWDAEQARALMKRFDLWGTRTFGGLSKGQKRRFILLLIMAQRPDLMVLDEPAGGLDTAVRRQFVEMLLEMSSARNNETDRPLTIMISSHILSDVERIVDHVAFMKKGRVTCEGQIEDLRARVKRICLASDRHEARVRERFRVVCRRREGDGVLLTVDDFAPERLDGVEATVEHLNLEDLFLVFNDSQAEATDGASAPVVPEPACPGVPS